jgi:hypothetical protein
MVCASSASEGTRRPRSSKLWRGTPAAGLSTPGRPRLAIVQATRDSVAFAAEENEQPGFCSRAVRRLRLPKHRAPFLTAHFEPAVPGERLAQEAVVLGQHVRVPLAQLAQQARGAFDVSEHKGDGAAREPAHGAYDRGRPISCQPLCDAAVVERHAARRAGRGVRLRLTAEGTKTLRRLRALTRAIEDDSLRR